jgi:hypothetical protein
MLSWYIAKCKYAFKMIQIIAKLDEVFSHILNMNWLYHSNYNWKVWFIWFHIKHLDQFFIQTSILSVLEKTFCWKITFIWKMIRNLLEAFVSKSILYVYQNVRWSQRKIVPKKDYIFLPKVAPRNVLSPLMVWQTTISFPCATLMFLQTWAPFEDFTIWRGCM